MNPLKVLVVDDEPRAIERLQLLLAGETIAQLVGTALDGEAALRVATAVAPDVVLLDIGMPDKDGTEVARELAALAEPPLVIFVTAFDSFAVAAFELEAIDYLMKPVARERLRRALERAAERRSRPQALEAPSSKFLEEFWVSEPHGIVRLAAASIDRISAERDYMRLHVGKRSWLINHGITKLEEQLDPGSFVRIHRSMIVRRDFVTGFRRDGHGHWHAQFRDGGEQKVGSTYLSNARGLAGR